MPTTGKQLRKFRRSADVTVVAVAACMGISRQALWAIERAAEVKAERVDAYRQAVQAVRDGSETTAA